MASTIINKSPQKVRLIINHIKGMSVTDALLALTSMPKGKTKKVFDLVKNASNNLKLTEADHDQYFIASVVAQEAQRLYRMVPRAKGASFRIRRRYTKIILDIDTKENIAKAKLQPLKSYSSMRSKGSSLKSVVKQVDETIINIEAKSVKPKTKTKLSKLTK